MAQQYLKQWNDVAAALPARYREDKFVIWMASMCNRLGWCCPVPGCDTNVYGSKAHLRRHFYKYHPADVFIEEKDNDINLKKILDMGLLVGGYGGSIGTQPIAAVTRTPTFFQPIRYDDVDSHPGFWNPCHPCPEIDTMLQDFDCKADAGLNHAISPPPTASHWHGVSPGAAEYSSVYHAPAGRFDQPFGTHTGTGFHQFGPGPRTSTQYPPEQPSVEGYSQHRPFDQRRSYEAFNMGQNWDPHRQHPRMDEHDQAQRGQHSNGWTQWVDSP